jgi:dTDP-4-amino-4,6-dideoxygalactose transaminase
MNTYKISFNQPNVFDKEFEYIHDAYNEGKVSGDGKYTKKCNQFLEEKLDVKKALLTTSCTHALEMAALLLNIKEGDEVICPSYTFVSTINAFILSGAKPVFCDIREDTKNINEKLIPSLITEKTKAIVVVHYAGVSCEMDEIMMIARKHNVAVIEDAAQAIDSEYNNKKAGSFGDMACLSFHETKNFSMGEGGALLINNKKYIERAEIIREKGTNRSKFFRGEVDKYSWVDIGSSYLPSDINAAILWRQFELFDEIQMKRKKIYNWYKEKLIHLENEDLLKTPIIPTSCKPNYHMFYLILESEKIRNKLMDYLKSEGILAVFHYLPLHKSEFFRKMYGELSLPITENISKTLIRLPFYYNLSQEEIDLVCRKIISFFNSYD